MLLADGINLVGKRGIEKEQALAALITFEKVARDWHRHISQNRWSEIHAGRVWRDMERNIGHCHIAGLKTKDLLEPLKVVEQNGHFDLTSRLTDIMCYAVQNDLIERNPAQDLFGVIVSRKATYRPTLKLDKLPGFWQGLKSYKGRVLTTLVLKFTLCVFTVEATLCYGVTSMP